LRVRPTDFVGATATPIGGWLNAAFLLLLAATVAVAHDLTANLMPALGGDAWARLTDARSPTFHPFWAPYLMYASMARALIATVLLALLALFLMRKHRVPALLIGFCLLLVLVALLEADCLRALGPAVIAEAGLSTPERVAAHLAGAVVLCAIGVPYLLRSRRVRQTFTR
jgi:hypothetical protein